MRLLRLVLRRYRGVVECELTFPEHGITVVEGDNEAGKSSAAEALRLLLECRDDSTAGRVKAVRPLHLDAGAEVEAEIAVGEVRFTYRKRWHRDRRTELRITAPTVEVHRGREAHDKVRSLLESAVDLRLWEALSTGQAAGLERPDLAEHRSLVAALDEAAGGTTGAVDDGGLLGLAADEAARWWSPTGRPRPALTGPRLAAEAAASAVAAARSAVEALEADVRWCDDLQRQRVTAEARLAAAEVAAAEAGARHDVALRASEAATGAAARAAAADDRAALDERAVADRRALVGALAARTDEAVRAAEAVGAAADAVRSAAVAVAEAEGAVAVAEGALRAAEAAVDGATDEHRRLGDAVLAERLATGLRQAEAAIAEVEALEAGVVEAATRLDACATDPAALAALEAHHDEVVAAEAALVAVRAIVAIDAEVDLAVGLDGEVVAVPAGATVRRAVGGELVVAVPGQVTVTVSSGARTAELEAVHARATSRLASACEALGVPDVAAARVAEAERRGLVEVLATRRRALDVRLGGRTLPELRAAADRARGELERLRPAGAPVEPGGVSAEAALADALARRGEAEGAHRDAGRALDRAEAAVRAARTDQAAAGRAHQLAGRAVDDARAAQAAAETALRTAREATGDDELELVATTARAAASTAAAEARAARAAVDDGALTAAASAAQRTAAERDGLRHAVDRLRDDLAHVRGGLAARDEAGLDVALATAERALVEADAERAEVERRAAAAWLLSTTLTRHRDDAARAYGAPLRHELEVLGRHVFGPTFTVTLGDDLRVATRTLDGVPVPWEQLSVGAKEQLAVLTRLAAALVVSPTGGVPVLFDDVLGWSDPTRRRGMATALAAAAERCQIVVLTCDPARYADLPRAATHRLGAPREVGGTRAAG